MTATTQVPALEVARPAATVDSVRALGPIEASSLAAGVARSAAGAALCWRWSRRSPEEPRPAPAGSPG
jgi:hypothetical protein